MNKYEGGGDGDGAGIELRPKREVTEDVAQLYGPAKANKDNVLGKQQEITTKTGSIRCVSSGLSCFVRIGLGS